MRIKNILLSTFFVLIISLPTLAQRGVPTFGQYSARVEKLPNIQVDLKSSKYARNYRTNLRNAAKQGVNFAGHFVVANWGCGTNCSETAIIDGRTGKVFFPEILQGATFGFCEIGDSIDEPIQYKKNSRVFILNGFKSGDLDKKDSKCGIYYFEWTGTALRQVKLVEKKRMEMP